VKIHSTASSVKNVKVVFLHGANVNLQRLTAHLDLQVLLDLLEILDNLVLLDLVVMMDNPVHPLLLAQLQITAALNAQLELLAHLDLMDHLDLPDLMDNPVHLEMLEALDPLAHPDLLVMLDQTETQELLDNLDLLEMMDNVELAHLDQRDLQEAQAHLAPLDQMEILEDLDLMAAPAPLDLLVIPELQAVMDNLAHLVVQVFLVQMPLIVLAHPDPLSSLAPDDLKRGKSAHVFDHHPLLFSIETKKVVLTLCAISLYFSHYGNKRVLV